MTLGGIVRENYVQFSCEKIEKQIKKHPESAVALKELGLETLKTLPNVPEWAQKYYKLFQE